MTDEQLALILAALSDQTNAINRLADAAEVIAHQIAPDQAKRLYAPNYMRPLRDYATFNWSSIGATVTAFDKHGATEVEHNSHVYKRYRSSDDDPKGIDIRFRRVASGTVDEKNLVWATLIKFADKKREPARPLRGELAETIQAAQTTQAPSLTAPGPMKIADAVSLMSQREPIPDALRTEWLAAYDAAGKVGAVPAEWHIAAEDTPATLATKTNALRIMIANAQAVPDEASPEPSPSPDEIIAATRTMLAEHTEQFLKSATGATKQQIADVKAVLTKHAGDEAGMRRTLSILLGKDVPNGAQVLALFSWLRPARGTDGVYAANKAAREIVKLAAQPQMEIA